MSRIAALFLGFGLICSAAARAEQPSPAVQVFLESLKPLASEEITIFAVPPGVAFQIALTAEELPRSSCEFKAKAGHAGGRRLLRLLSDPAPRMESTHRAIDLRVGIFAGPLKLYLDDFGVVAGDWPVPAYSRATVAAIRRLVRSPDFTLVGAHGETCTGTWKE
jgi:hypothetical protein